MGDTERVPKGGKPKEGRTLLGLGGGEASPAEGEAAQKPGELPRLGDRYRPLRELGQGGMGTVYLAEHAELGRPFAVKVLLPELSANDELVERLRREARAASQIRHPGIVDVTDFGRTEDGLAFVVMEHLEGEDLADRIIRQGSFDQEEAAEIALAVCRALEAAHDKGIIHRDVKPENIILVEGPSEGRQVKIVDFGLALSPGDQKARLTQHGATYGTPEYMAPEQCSGKGVTAASDIYALGAVLYEMLAGSPPFAEETPVETMARKLHESPEPPSERSVSAEIHEDLERVVMTALHIAPWERFGSMSEMAEALERALDAIRRGDGGARPARVAPRHGAAEPEEPLPAQSPRRRSALRIATALGLVALGAGAATLVVALRGDGSGGGAVDPATATGALVPRAGDAAVPRDRDGSAAEEAASPPPAGGDAAAPDDGAAAADGAEAAPGDGGGGTPRLPDPGGESRPERDPEGARRLVAEGKASLRRRDIAGARRAFAEAARLDPGNVDARGGLGTVAFEQGHHAEAVRHLERALRGRPGAIGWRLTLGSAYLRQGRRDRAVAEWERVLEQDPGNAAARRSLAAAGRAPP